MSQSIREEIVILAKELPDELLPEALMLLRSLVEKAGTTDLEASSDLNYAEFDKTMAAYQVISQKYKNALRELASVNEPLWISEEIVRVIHQDQIQITRQSHNRYRDVYKGDVNPEQYLQAEFLV
jgi:hypothetical protein